MIRFARDFRLIPVVLLATVCLFALKVSGLVFDGGYTLGDRIQQSIDRATVKVASRESIPDYPRIVFANGQRMPGTAVMPDKRLLAQGIAGDSDDITGSVEGDKKPAAAGPPLKTSTAKQPDQTKVKVDDVTVPIEAGKIASAGERAVLGRLQERRKELDDRSRELEMRENLLKATEKRLDAKLIELKDLQAKVKQLLGTREKNEAERFKSIVSMYENMKSKDAARILERLDMRIQAEVTSDIKPAKMSEIMAAMTPEAAERLTVELARRADSKSQSADQLPKIEGKPPGS
ncbi:MAG TPA: flagellar protein FlbB [Pseudolabrys sp.]|nr:flagellar protein FlbB [Pseudolabrys sp.]